MLYILLIIACFGAYTLYKNSNQEKSAISNAEIYTNDKTKIKTVLKCPIIGRDLKKENLSLEFLLKDFKPSDKIDKFDIINKIVVNSEEIAFITLVNYSDFYIVPGTINLKTHDPGKYSVNSQLHLDFLIRYDHTNHRIFVYSTVYKNLEEKNFQSDFAVNILNEIESRLEKYT